MDSPKTDAGKAPMQYPVASASPPREPNEVLEQFFAASADPFKSMSDFNVRRRSGHEIAPPQPNQMTAKESRKQLQKDMENRAAKSRIAKLSRKLVSFDSASNGRTPSDTAQAVKARAKEAANAPRVDECKTLSSFLTLLHRKSLTQQAERDVFKWISDFCAANKNADCEEDAYERFKGQTQTDAHVSISSSHAKKAADKYKSRILDSCEDKEWMTHPGPVGDIPLHVAFLFGEHELGKEMIEHAVKTLPGSEAAQNQYKHELVNAAYSSDLEWWFESGDPKSALFCETLTQLCKAPDFKEARKEALCTVGCDTACPHCAGEGGKDGGLFTGETPLHLAIVQHQVSTVAWLLSNGAFLHARARGLFFQPALIEKFEVDKTFWMLRDKTANTLGGSCYYGEYPLSFAAAVGDVHICHMLVDKAESLFDTVCRPEQRGKAKVHERDQGQKLVDELEEWLADNVCDWKKCRLKMEEGGKWDELVESMLSAFVNMRDARGNTALHMAVIYQKIKTVDWLLDNGADPSMRMLNNLHLTPLTLAVRNNSVEVFQHLAAKMQIKAWAYGSVVMTITNLEQIDTFRMQPKETPSADGVEGLRFRVRGRRQERALHQQLGGQQLARRGRSAVAPETPEERVACSLHADPNWRSALEVVVQHEIHAFHATPIFQQLVEDKWLNFARWHYLLHNICPYAAFVAFASVCIWQRASDIIHALDGSPAVPWDDALWDRSRYAVAGLEFVVYIAGVPFLLLQAWKSKRLKRLDLDPNEDLVISNDEFIFFLHKNASLMLNSVIAVLLLAVGVLRLQGPNGSSGWFQVDPDGPWRQEMDILSVIIMLAWCNFLHQLLPFKFVGPLLVTVWRMLIGDVTRWCIVFIFILVGFSQSIAILSNSLQVNGLHQELQETNLVKRDSAFMPMEIRSWTFMIDYIYVSMGEVGQDFIEDHRDGSGELMLTLHLLFIILSTLLLLNLLIALMGNTLATESSNEGFARWWMLQAEVVLRFERQLSEKARVRYRAGEPQGQIEHEEKKSSEFFRVLVGPDDDLDNDWGDAKPLTNEELKTSMDQHFEKISDVLFVMFQESRSRFADMKKLTKKVDQLAASVLNNGTRHALPAQLRVDPDDLIPQDASQRTPDTYWKSDEANRELLHSPNVDDHTDALVLDTSAAAPCAKSAEENGTHRSAGADSAESLASPREGFLGVADTAPKQPPPAQSANSDTSLPLPKLLRPLPHTHRKRKSR